MAAHTAPFEPSLLDQVVAQAVESVRRGNGPFASFVVFDGAIVGSGTDTVLTSHDPTAHSEVLAIRAAAESLGTSDLCGSALYSNGEPCSMCKAAIFWSNVRVVYFAAGRDTAAKYGFDDPLAELHREGALTVDGFSMTKKPCMRSEEPFVLHQSLRL